MAMGVRVGEGGTNCEISIDTFTMCKQTASGSLLYSTGHSAQGSVMTQRGWGRGGRQVQEGGNIRIHI